MQEYRAKVASVSGLVLTSALHLLFAGILMYATLPELLTGRQLPLSAIFVGVCTWYILNLGLAVWIQSHLGTLVILGLSELKCNIILGKPRSIRYADITCLRIVTTPLYRALRVEGGPMPIELSLEIQRVSDLIVEILNHAGQCRVVDVRPQLEKSWRYGAGYQYSPALNDVLNKRQNNSVKDG